MLLGIGLGIIAVGLVLAAYLGRKRNNTTNTAIGDVNAIIEVPASNSFLIAAGVSALLIGGATILLNTNEPEQKVILTTAQMSQARDVLQHSLNSIHPIPDDLNDQYFFKPATKAADGSTIYAKASYFIDNKDGTYTMRTISLDANGHFIGDPNSTVPFFKFESGKVVINPQAQDALTAQSALIGAAQDAAATPGTQVAAIRTAAAQSHNVTPTPISN